MSNMEPMPGPRDLHQYADSLESSAGHAEDLVGRDLDHVLLPDDEQRDLYGAKLDEVDTLTAEDAQAILDDEPGLVAEPYGRHLRGQTDYPVGDREYRSDHPGFADDGTLVVDRADGYSVVEADGTSGQTSLRSSMPSITSGTESGLSGLSAQSAYETTPVAGTTPPVAESVVMDANAGNSVENAIELKETEGMSQGKIVARRFFRHRGAIVGLIVLLAIILLAATSIGWGPIPGWWHTGFTDFNTVVNVGGAPTMFIHDLGTRGAVWPWQLALGLIALALLAAALYALLSALKAKDERAAQLAAAPSDDSDWVGYNANIISTPAADRLHNIARSIFRWALVAAVLTGLAYLLTHLEVGLHPFGQDNLGRDAFARVMRGTQQSLTIMFIIGVLSTLFGVLMGSISGFFRGHTDNIIMRFTDMVITIPTIVMGAILGVWVGGASPVTLAIALSFLTWTGMARLVRAQFLALREQEFVDAARVAGASNFRIMFKHILPNAVGVIVVNATLLMASAILLETALSFLGFGITAPDVSLGQIINEYQAAFSTRPWLFWWPGLLIVSIALCVNFIGDGLRDAFDPRQRRIPTARALARADARKAAKANRGTFTRAPAPPTTAVPVITAIPDPSN